MAQDNSKSNFPYASVRACVGDFLNACANSDMDRAQVVLTDLVEVHDCRKDDPCLAFQSAIRKIEFWSNAFGTDSERASITFNPTVADNALKAIDAIAPIYNPEGKELKL